MDEDTFICGQCNQELNYYTDENTMNNRQININDEKYLGIDKRIFIIGPISRFEKIKEHAKWLTSTEKNALVKFVKPQPDKNLDYLISECFDKIEESDIIEVIRKKDGTIGESVLYEMEYARRLDKEINILDI